MNHAESRRYNGFLGWVKIQRGAKLITPGNRGSETIIQQQTHIVIHPSFFRRAFELEYDGSPSWVPRTLRSYPVLIERETEVFHWCRCGNIELLQAAFSHQELSPFTVDEDGESLLHHASWGANVEMIRLLLQLGVNGNHEDVWGKKAVHRFDAHGRLTSEHSMESARLLIEPLNEISLKDVFSVTHISETYILADMLLSSLTSIENDVLPDIEPLYAVGLIRGPLRFWACGFQEWEPFIRKFVRLVHDIHGLLLWRSFLSGFFHALVAKNPNGEKDDAREWLSLLADEGVDVQVYLQEEYINLGILASSGQMRRLDCVDGLPRHLVFEMGDHLNVW